jgi:hypothetical protein
MDLILKSLQCIIRGGDDAVDSNIVILCEDDNEDSQIEQGKFSVCRRQSSFSGRIRRQETITCI